MPIQQKRYRYIAAACLLGMSTLWSIGMRANILHRSATPSHRVHGSAPIMARAMQDERARAALAVPTPSRARSDRVELSASTGDPGEALVVTATRSRLAQVAAALARSFERDTRHAEYLACRNRGGDCGRLLTELGYAAFYGGLYERFDADEFGFAALSREHDPAAIHAVLAQVVARSADPLQRTAALAVLERTDELGRHELPLDAYQGLSSLSTLEVQLLLGRHANRPITSPELAAEVAALGTLSDDPRVVGSGLTALAHASTDRELAELVGRMRLDAETRLDLERVLGRCADACPQTLATVLQREEPEAVAALQGSVAWADDSRHQPLRDVVRRLSDSRVELSAN